MTLRTLGIAALIAGLLPLSVRAQEEPDAEELARQADFAGFERWLKEYRSGAVRLVSNLVVDQKAVQQASDKMAAVARWNDLAGAKSLFQAATVDPTPPGSRSSADRIEFHAELLPWRIRRIARANIAKITAPGVDDWLLAMVFDNTLRDRKAVEARAKADAALQVLGLRDFDEGKLALKRASMALPPKLRIRALDVMSSSRNLEVVQHFIDLLRDKEPNMRIAAAAAIGKALQPHTDETVHDDIPSDVVKQRDRGLTALGKLLKRDKVWQVRASAANALIEIRTRHAIPVLIAGFEAELKRKKDPWAMDVRMHRALERITGQSVPMSDARVWKKFWSAEKSRFRLARNAAAAKADSTLGERYEKFFSLDLDSDRVLFVIDFSGSMEEQITLKTEGTAAKPGQTIRKARLVVEEMKKIIMSLSDGAIFNIIVFSDEVRVWRPDGNGRPAAVKLDDETRDDLLGSFLDSLSPQGPTNLYGAMDRALGLNSGGIGDGRYTEAFDTIYVLSDGAPTFGDVRDKEEIRRQIREANHLKRVTIHSITFGELNDVEFLRHLAEENGGRHIHVE